MRLFELKNVGNASQELRAKLIELELLIKQTQQAVDDMLQATFRPRV